MSDLDNVNSAFSVTVYKKLQKQISPLVEKLNQLEENTHLIETTPGPKGDKGIKGDQGIAGRDGERGLIGEQGIAGPQGKTGDQGLIGEQGLQGIQGDKGDKGETGDQGIAGPQGVIGPQGIQGEKGDTGDTGEQGIKGDKGDTGQQGIQGNPGKDGLIGKTGAQGIQGLKGDTGAKGDTGETGADGKPGTQGIQGEAGPQGEAGVDGSDGKDAELPDIDKIIEPHFVKVKKELDLYTIKSDKDFNNYRTVINKSISNMAGGGVVKLRNLVDVQTSTAKVDGNFLKYDGSTNKWVGVDIAAGAPEQLNTLNELADALNDDENFATTVTNSIAAKASQTDLDTHTSNTTNPHSVTASQVGLGNVTNESKATMFTDPTFTGDISATGKITAGTNLELGGNIVDTDANEIITIAANDVTFTHKHIKSGFSVGIRNQRGNVKGMDQGSTSSNLGLYCNSIEALSIKEDGDVIVGTGNVGIGTDSPSVALHVEEGFILADGASTSHGFELRRDSLDTFQIRHLDGNFTINNFTDGRKDLSIDGNGNVGIGNVTPAVALHIKGDLRVDDTDGSPTLTYDSSANALNAAGATFEINKSNGVDVAIGNNDFYVDMSTSRVGIGTRTPAEALDVTGNIKTSGTIQSTSYEAGDFPTSSANTSTTAAFKADGTLTQDLKEVCVHITGADIKNSGSTPLVLINSPGAGKAIQVVEFILFVDYASPTATILNSTNVKGQLYVEGSDGVGSNQVVTYGTILRKFLVASGDTLFNRDVPVEMGRLFADSALKYRTVIIPSGPVNFDNTPGSTYKFKIRYRIIDIANDFTSSGSRPLSA